MDAIDKNHFAEDIIPQVFGKSRFISVVLLVMLGCQQQVTTDSNKESPPDEVVSGASHHRKSLNERGFDAGPASVKTGLNGASHREVASTKNNTSMMVEVKRVVDGDTIWVAGSDGDLKIRIRGIDCPESSRNSKCKAIERNGGMTCSAQIALGQKSKLLAKRIVQGRIALEHTGPGAFEKDQYGRILAYIRLPDGEDLGEIMISQGGCSDFGWKYPHPRSTRYKALMP